MQLNDQELATILASLRYYQHCFKAGPDERKMMFPEHFSDVQPLSDEEIDELCDRLNLPAADVIKHNYVLTEQLDPTVYGPDETWNPRTIEATVEFGNGQISIGFKGYGDCCSDDGFGQPVLVELARNELRAVLWSDINEQDPTHTVSLENAKETNRREDLQ